MRCKFAELVAIGRWRLLCVNGRPCSGWHLPGTIAAVPEVALPVGFLLTDDVGCRICIEVAA